MQNHTHAHALLINVYAYWGFTTILMKHILVYMNASSYIMFRFLFAALFILLFLRKKLAPISRQTLIKSAIMGFLVIIPMEFSVAGLQYTSAANSVFISQLSIVVVPTLLYLRKKQVPPIHLLISILFILFGLSIFADIFNNGLNIGDIITFGAMFFNSINIIIISKFSQHEDALQLGALQMLFAALFSSLPAFFLMEPISFTKHVIAILILTGMIGSGLAYVLQVYCIKNISPINVSLISILSPIMSLFGSIMIPDNLGKVNQLYIHQIIGTCIICTTLILYFIIERYYKNNQYRKNGYS